MALIKAEDKEKQELLMKLKNGISSYVRKSGKLIEEEKKEVVSKMVREEKNGRSSYKDYSVVTVDEERRIFMLEHSAD